MMSAVKVAGGSYLEICEVPRWNRLFGSGGRAAVVLSSLTDRVELHTYSPADRLRALREEMNGFGVSVVPSISRDAIAFAYFHPLSTPHIEPNPARVVLEDPLRVSGEIVLRFGFIEGDAIVDADRAVYDPQALNASAPFHANGSSARALAIVLNEQEVLGAGGTGDVVKAAAAVIEQNSAEVVVVKRGPKGAAVHCRDGTTEEIPAYRSSRVFKIGTGDVFSAVFAFHWAVRGVPPSAAADLASRAVAAYADSAEFQGRSLDDLGRLAATPRGAPGVIYLAAEMRTLGQRWMAEETRWCLRSLGAEVATVRGVTANISECAAVLALVESATSPTLDQISAARDLGVPVVALAEGATPEMVALLTARGAEVTDDFASAVYRTFWAAIR